jgi:hypothetical protein
MLRSFLTGLVVALAAVVGTAALAQDKRLALVIGNGAYRETAQLPNPRNDALDMSAVLRRLGFQVLEGLDLEKRQMERLIREFDQKLEGAALALFFYAGHGVQVAGQNHLVPVDARLAAEGDIDFESLSLNLILTRMERRAKTSLVLLDACRDNPLARNLARTMGTRSQSVGQGLAEVRTGLGSLISFSTQPGNVALDGSGRNSPYTAALLRHLEAPGRDVLSSLAAVRGEVVAATGGKQVPWEHTSLLGPVVLRMGGATPPAPPKGASTEAAPSASVEAAAADAWPHVRDSSDIAVLEAFIRRFGNSFYGDMARIRLDGVRKASVGSPVPAPPLPAPSTQPLPACAKGTIWAHNGSEMQLVAEGRKRAFRYLAPRPSLAEMGIREGTLLFNGERVGDRYEGVARRFSERCGVREYRVSGEVDGERRVILRGTVRGLDPSSCRPGSSYDDLLEFDFVRCAP